MHLFSSEAFIPHGHCYLWKTGLVWLHIIADASIAIAYYSIPIALIYFVRKRKDLPFNWIFFLFGAFIVACGTTHLMEIWTLWHPTYWLSGFLKAITAVVSLYTALALIPLVPKALALPSPIQLEKANKELEHEIIERKLVEDALRESEQRFHNAFDYAAIGMAIVGLDGRWLQVNRALCEIVGYCEEELLSTNFQAITHPDDLECDLYYVNQLLSGKIRYYQVEKRYFHSSGHIVWILLNASLVHDAQGQPLYFVSQIQDITQRKQAEEELRHQKELLQTIFDHIPVMINFYDVTGETLLVNRELERVLGWSKAELEEIDRLAECYPDPKEHQRVLELMREASGEWQDFKTRTKDGRILDTSWANIRLSDGTAIGIGSDISERKRAEEQLRWQEALLRLMTNASPLAFYVVDNRSDDILYFNHRFCKIWGIEHLEEQMQRGILKNNDIIPDCLPLLTDVAAFAESCKPLQSEENRVVVEDEIPFVDERTIRRFSAQVRDEEDRYFGRLYIFEDITQRKQAEERLRLLERAVAASNNGIIISDAQSPDNPAIYVNSGFERITGYTQEEVIGKNCRFLQGTDKAQAALEELRHAMDSGSEAQVIVRNYRKDGSLFWNEFCITPVHDETGNLTHFIGVQTDISERKQAEEALRQSEERFRGLVNSAPVGIFQTDLLGDCLFVNSRWLEIAERSKEEALAMGWENVIHPDDREPVFTQWYDAAARGREFARECSLLTPQGKVKWVFVTAVPLRECSGAIIGYLGSVKDISDSKQAEEALQQSEVREREKAKELELTLSELKRTQGQLIQAEKMSGLGQMVAGIAHEINNPISFIYANITPAKEYSQDLLHLIDLYQQHYPSPIAEIAEQIEIIEPDFIKEDFPKLLASMEEGADRISQIVWSLRNFSRLDEAECKQVDIHEGIENTLFILQHRLKPQPQRREIQLIKEYGQLPKVECYPSDLNQVFMNILCNAIDALDEFALSNQDSAVSEKSNNNGQLTTDFIPTIRICTDVVGASRVVIRIANNNDGIKAEVLPKIFDPFFTTKPPGKGKGLGLFIGYQIVVDKHGGELTCHSVMGQGTEFTIELPIIQTKQPQTREVYATSTLALAL